MNNREMAKTYADGWCGKYGNAECDYTEYRLYGHVIVKRDSVLQDLYYFNWCGHHTRTTARHMNNILQALNSDHRVSYAKDRDNDTNEFVIRGATHEQNEA